jgi:hypothetical protein
MIDVTRMFDSRSVVGFRVWPLAVAFCFALPGCGGTVRGGPTEVGDGGPGGSSGSGGVRSTGKGGGAGRSTGGSATRCPAPLTWCNGCVDTQISPNHCGACFSGCTSGTDCVNGTCQSTSPPSGCSDGQTYCSNFSRCIDTRTNAFACGSCHTPCTNSEACVDGRCQPGTCFPGLTDCGGLDGSPRCVDVMVNHNHCGACGNACGSYENCQSGKCIPPECSLPYVYCRNSGCTDTMSDVSSCGACGNSCTSGAVFDYSAYACTNGTCGCAPLANACGSGCSTQFWFCPPPGFSGAPADLCIQTARNNYQRCACKGCLAEITACATSSSCINSMDCSLQNVCVGCGDQTFPACSDQQGQTDPLADKLVTCMNVTCQTP